jgi:nucleotide-binding universal stress UspA family protein
VVFRCVVVATDGSRTAEVAVQHGIALARGSAAHLHLVNARRSGGGLMATTPETAAFVGTCLAEEADAQGKLGATLERRAAELRAEGIEVAVHCRVGDPAEVIVRLAEEVGADLVVVGNRGMQRRMLGSVPNSVSHRAPCSVLIVRTT